MSLLKIFAAPTTEELVQVAQARAARRREAIMRAMGKTITAEDRATQDDILRAQVLAALTDLANGR